MKGMGVMINELFGDDRGSQLFSASVGKRIEKLSLKDDALEFIFSDGMGIAIFDDGQSCCENRYMTTDDDLSRFIGAELVSAETSSAPNIEYEDGDHEVQFLKVTTSFGVFTMESHNEHNGYYGGFSIDVREVEK